MMNSQEVISLYETVAAITDQMLTAARNGNWNELIELESRCSRYVATLKSGEAPVVLTGVARERKVEMIRKILADDREIRNLTEPWMARLSQLIHNTGTRRKLNKAYGASHAR